MVCILQSLKQQANFQTFDAKKERKIKWVDTGSCNISNTRNSVSSGFPNTEKRVENTTRSGVFLTKFEVFG